MAIVQISRITHRKGLQENLPQLEGGEFGWSTDSQRLFIGNGTTQEPPDGDGAPTIGNTEILTEHTDILPVINNYTYKGDQAGYTVQTGPSANDNITRTLQHKLDDMASIRDFGAVGDGSTDDTAAINRALFQMFCRSDTELSRRSLFFPAGDYLVTSTVLVPPYAKLVGEGLDSTVITYNPPEWSVTAAYLAGQGVIKSTGDNTGRYEAKLDVPVGTDVSNTTYWKAVDGIALRTTDDEQQYGENNGIGSRVSSRFIDVQGLSIVGAGTLSSSFPVTVLQVESALHCTFTNVGIHGPATSTSELANIVAPSIIELFPASIGIELVSPLRGDSTTQITRGIIFDKCYIDGVGRGIYVEDDVQGVTISNTGFETQFRGVHFAVAAGTSGPSGIRVISNRFDNIYHNGIYYNGPERNITAYNMFENVANADTTNTYKQPVVVFTSDDNVSMGDMFLRTDAAALISPRIEIGNTKSYAMEMSKRISFGSYNREVGTTATLTDNTPTATTIFTKDAYPDGTDPEESVLRSFKMTYTIYRDTSVRTGIMTVVSSISDDSSSTLTYEDDYHENATTGVVLSVAQSGEDISVQYTCTNTGQNATMRYSLEYMTSAAI